jgi:hypothetical protein
VRGKGREGERFRSRIEAGGSLRAWLIREEAVWEWRGWEGVEAHLRRA